MLTQNYTSWEVIFFDSASTDQSLSIAQAYAAKHAQIHCIAHPSRPILGQARNLAIMHARGTYLAFLDADDLWEAQKLTLQVALLESNPSVHAVCTDTVFFSSTTRQKRKKLTRVFSRAKPARGMIFEQLIQRQWVILSSVMVRRHTVQLLGGFDHNLQLAADADLFYRLAHDYAFDFIPQVLTHRRMHAHNITHSQGHLWPQEIQAILTKFRTLWPPFDTHYPFAAKALVRRCAFHDAVHHWQRGQGSKARKILQKTFFHTQSICHFSIKAGLFYALSFAPPRIFHHAQRLYWHLPSFLLKEVYLRKKTIF